MATSKAVQHLRRTVLLQDGAGLPDGELLACFVERRDDAAFAALVRRHGPMVWGVCRRLLSHHDAEDAFQAAFLVLCRKAASIVPRSMVANWLYGVAHQTALQARRTAARRGARERQVADMPEPAVVEQDLWNDLQPLLDRELTRLPDKYRVVIVLCDLEGKSRKEAAQQLGCPEGTVASRLTRARSMLARRLARHGLAVGGGALATMLSRNVASAGVPAPVACATLKAASLLAAGQAAATGVIPAQVAALTEGVLKTMLLSRLKIATALLLLFAVLLGGAGMIYQTQAAERPKALTERQRADREKVAGDEGPMKATPMPPPPQPVERHRILRWRIVFNTKDGEEYARQLEALGARIALPTRDHQYRLICDLSQRPAKSTIEDISGTDHIFMVDSNKDSIQLLTNELGLKETPEHIVVFLPRFVEDELLRKELDFAHRSEKDIVETTFQFSRTKRGLDIKVTSQR
jgi:RNA polymerase sigma factor (sigma-70 family)